MTKPETKTINLSVPVDMYEALAAQAEAEDRPLNRQTIRVLRQGLGTVAGEGHAEPVA